MYSNVSEWLNASRRIDRVRPRVKLGNGITMSIQASEYHYCKPKQQLAKTYSHVEVGYPSQEIPELLEYAEVFELGDGGIIDYGECVYPYVPVEVLDNVISSNGGIVGIQESSDQW